MTHKPAFPRIFDADTAKEIWRLAIQIHHGDTESMHTLRKVLSDYAPEWGTQ